jgi:hypothetical protein
MITPGMTEILTCTNPSDFQLFLTWINTLSPDWISAISNMIMAGATAWAATAAIGGINSWRSQLIGETDLNECRGLILALSKLEASMRVARFIKIREGEVEFELRVTSMRDAWREFLISSKFLTYFWQNGFQEKVTNLNNTLETYFLAVKTYQDVEEFRKKKDQERVNEINHRSNYDDVLFGSFDTKDTFGVEFLTNFASIDETLKLELARLRTGKNSKKS